MKINRSEYSIFIILFVVGIVSFFMINSMLSKIRPSGETGTVTATIVKLDSRIDSEGDVLYTPHLEYEVDGIQYNEVLNVSSNTYKLGNTINIYYLLEDPTQIYSITFNYLAYLFYILPLVFCLVSGFGFFLKIKVMIRKNLKKVGTRIEAQIKNITLNTRYSVNGVNPYVIYCTYFDIDGTTYEFKSENIWENPNINSNGTNTISVYVDPKNYKKYYVDVQEYLDVNKI